MLSPALSPSKPCSKCGEIFPFDTQHFYRNKSTASGLTPQCKGCMLGYAKGWYSRNQRRAVTASTERIRQYRLARPEFVERERERSRQQKRREHACPDRYAEHLLKQREWNANNPDRVKLFKHHGKAFGAARTAARNARKKSATPRWADLVAISEIYAECQRMNALGGEIYEVDHIVPLAGKNVCGLHVHWNLQILTAEENRRKNNRLLDE